MSPVHGRRKAARTHAVSARAVDENVNSTGAADDGLDRGSDGGVAENVELDLLDGTTVNMAGNVTFGVSNWAGPLLQIEYVNILLDHDA